MAFFHISQHLALASRVFLSLSGSLAGFLACGRVLSASIVMELTSCFTSIRSVLHRAEVKVLGREGVEAVLSASSPSTQLRAATV